MPARTAYAGTALAGDVYTAANHARMPGGWIGYAEVTANIANASGAEAPLAGLSITVTVGATRRIRVTGAGAMAALVGIPTRAYGIIRQDGVNVGRFLEDVLSSGGYETRGEASVVLTPSAGVHTYSLASLAFDAGGTPTGVQVQASAVRPAFVLVEDLGPAT